MIARFVATGIVLLLSHAAGAQDVFPLEVPAAWQVKCLPGQAGRVFSLYGCPGNLEEVKRLIARMKETGLGNGFDPGPTTVAANAALYRYFAEINWPVVGYPPYGEMFDVVLSNAGADLLASYPVLLLVGDHEFDALFISHLFDALRAGSRVLLHPRHVKALGKDFARLQGTGKVEVLDAWTNPATHRPPANGHIECAPGPVAGHLAARAGWGRSSAISSQPVALRLDR